MNAGLVAGNDGNILFVGSEEDTKRWEAEQSAVHGLINYACIVDATNKCILPGFIDPHCHGNVIF